MKLTDLNTKDWPLIQSGTWRLEGQIGSRKGTESVMKPCEREVKTTFRAHLPLALAAAFPVCCSRFRQENMKRILVIEDDKDIVELVKYNLEKDGFQVVACTDGATGNAQVRKARPDLLILDLMLPKLSGLEICKEIRKDVSLNRLPILILTAKGEEADRVVGLELGADDYVTKPFSPRELVARVKALLRRADPGTTSDKPLDIGALRIDPAAYRVTRAGKPVPMSTLEFRLLYFLAARPNRVFTRDQLLDGVWGTERFVTPRSVDVYVRRLREKVEAEPQHPAYMKTIRGAGYIFETRAS